MVSLQLAAGVPLRANGISVEDLADEVPDFRLERYRTIPETATSAACYHLAQQWLSNCRNNHKHHGSEVAATYRFRFPFRLINIGYEDPRLWVVLPQSVYPEYVALSHCWGGTLPLQTLKSNLARHMRQGVQKGSLPETFRDAINVARQLGFQYLWIDSLCIVQDDEQDWEEQSSQMDSVYGLASLVLAASVAASTEDGFLRTPRFRHAHTVKVPPRAGSGHPLRLKYRPLSLYQRHDPLDTRGWALQERLSATRYLAYGEQEMYYVCADSATCECGCYQYEFQDGNKIQNIQKDLLAPVNDLSEIGHRWRKHVLRHYTDRELTKSTDKLVALSALAFQIQHRFEATYLAGIWKEDLVRELLWFIPSDKPSHRVESFYAPSWSWISVSADGDWRPYDSDDYDTREVEEPLVEVLDAKTTPLTVNRFGPVIEGTVKLLGMALTTTTESYWGYRIKHPYISGLGRVEVSFTFDTPLVALTVEMGDGIQERSARRLRHHERVAIQTRPDEITVTMVPLVLLSTPSDSQVTIFGLVLGRSATHAGCYERVGTFGIMDLPRESIKQLKAIHRREISIV